jgi:intein/homing endonuclease
MYLLIRKLDWDSETVCSLYRDKKDAVKEINFLSGDIKEGDELAIPSEENLLDDYISELGPPFIILMEVNNIDVIINTSIPPVPVPVKYVQIDDIK